MEIEDSIREELIKLEEPDWFYSDIKAVDKITDGAAVAAGDPAAAAKRPKRVTATQRCKLCRCEVSVLKAMQIGHAMTWHNSTYGISCPYCDYQVKYQKKDMMYHLASVHSGEEQEPIDDRPTLFTKSDIDERRRQCFDVPENENEAKNREDNGIAWTEASEEERGLRVFCLMCQIGFYRPALLARHTLRSHGRRNYIRCPACPYETKESTHRMMNHIKKKHRNVPEDLQPIDLRPEYRHEINELYKDCIPGRTDRFTLEFPRNKYPRRECKICGQFVSQVPDGSMFYSHAVYKHLDEDLLRCPKCPYSKKYTDDTHRNRSKTFAVHFAKVHGDSAGRMRPVDHRRRAKPLVRQIQETCFPGSISAKKGKLKQHPPAQMIFCHLCRTDVSVWQRFRHPMEAHYPQTGDWMLQCRLCHFGTHERHRILTHLEKVHTPEEYRNGNPVIDRSDALEKVKKELTAKCFPSVKRQEPDQKA